MDNTNIQTDTNYEDHIISHPVKYERNKDYLLFPKTTYDGIKFLDCNDTITGHCIRDVDIDECIKTCEDGDCGSGYFIKTPSSTICVPLNLDVFPTSSPVYKMRKQDIYPEFDKSDVTSFIDTTVYPFPPNMANTTFYLDVMQLVDTRNNLSLGQQEQDSPIAIFDKAIGTHIQLISREFSNTLSSRYIPVKFRDHVYFRIPGTTYVLTRKDNTFEWHPNPVLTSEKYDTFQMISTKDPDSREVMNYGDRFYLRYGNITQCAVGSVNDLIASSDSFESLENQGYSTEFVFSPKMLSYYCEDGKCKTIPLEKTQTDGPRATYNGNQIYISPVCYNICGGSNGKKMPIWIWIVIAISIVVLITLTILLFIYMRR